MTIDPLTNILAKIQPPREEIFDQLGIAGLARLALVNTIACTKLNDPSYWNPIARQLGISTNGDRIRARIYKTVLEWVDQARCFQATNEPLRVFLGQMDPGLRVRDLLHMRALYLPDFQRAMDAGHRHLTVTLKSPPSRLISLTFLSMGDQAALFSISTQFESLTRLTALSLHDSTLAVAPPCIATFKQLLHLYLGNNRITYIPKKWVSLTRLENLSLNSNCLTEIPGTIDRLIRLESFSAAQNQIVRLPPQMANLPRLRHINLEHNQLTSIPGEFSTLRQLESLGVAHNQLVCIDLSTLTSLKLLDLSSNLLTRINGLNALTNLRNCFLSDNQLVDSNESVATLTRLEKLRLNGNLLTRVPIEIASLTQLEFLDLSDNAIIDRAGALRILRPHTRSRARRDELGHFYPKNSLGVQRKASSSSKRKYMDMQN